MSRAYYQASLLEFLHESADSIIGKITQNHPQQLEHLQTGAWLGQVEILQAQLETLKATGAKSHIYFEFLIPRMGKRADVVLVHEGLVFVIEFKVGSNTYHSAEVRQAHGYAIDLKNFHQGSHDKVLVPVLVATHAKNCALDLDFAADDVCEPLLVNNIGISALIADVCIKRKGHDFDINEWSNSGYKPTPSIVEAAQALYSNHAVEDISRSDAGAKNIAYTSEVLFEIIHNSRLKKQKSICFVTGVPGAGKTLVGLNIATKHSNPDDDEYAVFLSGNGPLVEVLREALARDESKRTEGLSKAAAFRKASQFIQNIHHFRDEAIKENNPPIENVVIFDEAQRAWDKEQTSKFMRQKRALLDFDKSEPEFLIDVMDRHKDWCVVIALIGGGQEINTGEAGIKEWFNAIDRKFSHWNVYYSNELTSDKYVSDGLSTKFNNLTAESNKNLHLATSMRSFRSENLSEMVHHLIAGDSERSKHIFEQFRHLFPIVLTRDLNKAKLWIRKKARATETKGVVASSGAIRLKPKGVFVKNRFHPREWFLNEQTDIRSCHYLEDVATEFDIQGLELDWCLVAWDADFRFTNKAFEHWQFVGTKWQRRIQMQKQRYLENAYRVLLTRARQGMIIFIPQGDENDPTRPLSFYDGTYEFLKSCGILEI